MYINDNTKDSFAAMNQDTSMNLTPTQKDLLQHGLEKLGIEYTAKILELFTIFIHELALWNRPAQLFSMSIAAIVTA